MRHQKIKLDNSKPVFFISDTHLHEKKPELTSLFLKFITEKASDAQALFILGDMFDVWLGDDITTPFEQDIARALVKLYQAGTNLYFMQGNRDFLLEERYCQTAGLTKLNDPFEISYHNKTFLLTHGDLLCTDDTSYQLYRKVARSPICKFIFLNLPKKYRNRIAQKLRQKSKSHQQMQPIAKLDVTENGVIKILKHSHASQIIHGHVHRARHVKHTVNNQTIDRHVLGTWHKNGSYIKLEGNKVDILTFE